MTAHDPSEPIPAGAGHSAAPEPPREVALIPPPFWWARRIGLALLALVILLALLWTAWAIYARTRLNKARNEATALGEPIRFEDLDSEDPDHDNALQILINVGEACSNPRESDPNFSNQLGQWADAVFLDRLPSSVRRKLSTLDAPLAQLEALSATPFDIRDGDTSNRPRRIRAPAFGSVPLMHAERSISTVLLAAIVRDVDDGDLGAALRRIELAASVESLHLCTMGPNRMPGEFPPVIQRGLEYLLPRIAPDKKEADLHARLGRLQNHLLDESDVDFAGRSLCVLYRLARLEQIDGFRDEDDEPRRMYSELGIPRLVTVPVADLAEARVYEQMREFGRSLSAERPRAMPGSRPEPAGAFDTFYSMSHPTDTIGFNERSTADLQIERRSLRRLTALAIAAWRFHHENGRFPTTLDELTPTFIGRIPEDPFSEPPASMRIDRVEVLPFVHLSDFERTWMDPPTEDLSYVRSAFFVLGLPPAIQSSEQ